VYRDMNRVTLTVVAVLLAVPALAQAKVGIEFDRDIQTQQPGDRQTFTVIIHSSGGGGGHSLVSFTNVATGKVIRARAASDGSGSVVFPDRGPWSSSISIGGKPVEQPIRAPTFQLAPAPARAAAPPPSDDGGGFPAWLLTLPAAGLAALGIWLVRRRPRELGA
jgi:hypothetical protein